MASTPAGSPAPISTNAPYGLEEMQATEAASFSSLPVEIILQIFDAFFQTYTLEDDLVGVEGSRDEAQLLFAPLHISSRIRTILSERPAAWVWIARNMQRKFLTERGYQELLKLCSRLSKHALDCFNLQHIIPARGPCCWAFVSKCSEIVSQSEQSLTTITLAECSEGTRCACVLCRKVPSRDDDFRNEWFSQAYNLSYNIPPPTESMAAKSLLKLLSQASGLQTLDFHFEKSNDESVAEAIPDEITARPTKLLFSADYQRLNGKEQGLLTQLACQVQTLSLIQDRSNSAYYGEDLTIACEPHNVILRSAASTLRHLQITGSSYLVSAETLVEASFDCLETLFVVLEDERSVYLPLQYRRQTSRRCQMPALHTIFAPFSFASILNAPAVRTAGLVLEPLAGFVSAIDIPHWLRLETLAFYMDPGCSPSAAQFGADVILKTLVTNPSSQTYRYPALQDLAFHYCPRRWWEKRIKINEMPIQWDWRQDQLEDSFQKKVPVIDSNLALLEQQRRTHPDDEDSYAEEQNRGGLKEMRVFGFRIACETLEELKAAPPPFKLFHRY